MVCAGTVAKLRHAMHAALSRTPFTFTFPLPLFSPGWRAPPPLKPHIVALAPLAL
jgi:hypothetical protein